MSGIFKILFNLSLKSHNRPLEDYLTELFSYCLSNDKELLMDFLIQFNIHHKPFERFDLTTQFELIKLQSHESNSRPDMALFLDDHTVFFENKIEANEGHLQLQRYAEHLSQLKKIKTLVYITKHHDPKDENTILKNCPEVNFKQIKWGSIYNFLKKYKSNLLILELLKFMKQIKLSMNNQFSPIDILTLSNFSNVKKMLDGSMNNNVSEEFTRINIGRSQDSASMTQLRDHDRYIYYANHNQGMWIGLGFWMNSNNEKNYPDVSIVIEVDPKSNKKIQITETFKKLGEQENDWYSYNTNNPSNWCGVKYHRSLQNFLSEDNQVEKIKEFFIEGLKQTERILIENPSLPRRII